MVTSGGAPIELPALPGAHLYAVLVEWLADRLADPGWRRREHAGAEARAVLDHAERLARVAASGHDPLPGAGGWWSSADVAEHTDTPERTVRRHMSAGRWPSARWHAGRWFVRPADVLAEPDARDGLDGLDPRPTSSAAWHGAPLAELLPPPLDELDKALRAVLERSPATVPERRELVERFRVARARAALYRHRQARRRAPLRVNTPPEGRTAP